MTIPAENDNKWAAKQAMTFFLEVASPWARLRSRSEIQRPVFEHEPIIGPKIWLHEMRPSTVPVFAFAKAGHSNGGQDRGRTCGGGDLQKKGYLGGSSGHTATLPSHNSSLQ